MFAPQFPILSSDEQAHPLPTGVRQAILRRAVVVYVDMHPVPADIRRDVSISKNKMRARVNLASLVIANVVAIAKLTSSSSAPLSANHPVVHALSSVQALKEESLSRFTEAGILPDLRDLWPQLCNAISLIHESLVEKKGLPIETSSTRALRQVRNLQAVMAKVGKADGVGAPVRPTEISAAAEAAEWRRKHIDPSHRMRRMITGSSTMTDVRDRWSLNRCDDGMIVWDFVDGIYAILVAHLEFQTAQTAGPVRMHMPVPTDTRIARINSEVANDDRLKSVLTRHERKKADSWEFLAAKKIDQALELERQETLLRIQLWPRDRRSQPVKENEYFENLVRDALSRMGMTTPTRSGSAKLGGWASFFGRR